MPDPDVPTFDEVTDDVAEAPATTDEIPDTEASEPMICDPVIGFVCPQAAMKRI